MPDQTTDQTARANVIDSLRQLADYLDQHPGVPVNLHGWSLLDFPRRAECPDDATGRAHVDRVADVLGVTVTDDTPDGGHYRAIKTFGPVTYEYVWVTRRPDEAPESSDDTQQAA